MIAAQYLQQLKTHIQGAVIEPSDTSYNIARQAWNLNIDQYPAVIVVAANVHDVAVAVRFAQAEGLAVAIQTSGHGIISAANDAVLIVTTGLTDVEIDAPAQTAVLGGGVKWGKVLELAQAEGLAPLLGSSPDVGAVGYTLGGGMGWLARQYGLSADSVIYFDLVTPAGEEIRVSADENAELFWALRGGGGNFGIVTAMKIRLYPVTTVYGGNLFYPIENAKEVFMRYAEWTKQAPDQLTSSMVIMNFPPIPQLPDILRGKTYAMIRGCFTGSVQEGEELLKFWREWQAPVIDDFKEMSFADVATISSDPVDPLPGISTGLWLRELGEGVFDTLLAAVPAKNGPAPLVFAEIRHAGGAIARVGGKQSAYGNRDARFILQMIGVTPTAEAQQATKQAIAQIQHGLEPYLTGGVYLNFMDGEEARERTRDGYSAENFERLGQMKAEVDPDNCFRHTFDLLPA